jgi:hypothetical protein
MRTGKESSAGMSTNKRLSHSSVAAGALALIVLTTLGCGRSPKLVPVEGIVTLDGKPLVGASIFLAVDGSAGRDAYGPSNPDGTFAMTTVGHVGATPGNYRVMVCGIRKVSSTDDPMAAERAVRKMAKTPMTAGGRPIPPIYSDFATTPLRCTVPVDGKLVLTLSSAQR